MRTKRPEHAGGHRSREKWEEQREKLLGIRRGDTLQLHTETDGKNNLKGIEHWSYKPGVVSSILARALLLGSRISGCQHKHKESLKSPAQWAGTLWSTAYVPLSKVACQLTHSDTTSRICTSLFILDRHVY